MTRRPFFLDEPEYGREQVREDVDWLRCEWEQDDYDRMARMGEEAE